MICFKSMGFDRNLNQDCCLNRDFQDYRIRELSEPGFSGFQDFQDKRIV